MKGHYRSAAGGSEKRHIQSEYVVIFLVVFRLLEKSTDIVISLNYPVREPAEIEAIHDADTSALLSWIDRHPGLGEAEATLKDIIENFEILDWSLFDEDDEE